MDTHSLVTQIKSHDFQKYIAKDIETSLYVDQLCTTSFPIGLVKAESGITIRTVETDLGR